MANVAEVTDATFAAQVLQSSRPVLVDYWADWCSPCKQIAPIIDELSREYPNVKFVKVDTNTNPNLAAEQGVLSLPTLQFFHGGRVEKSLTGGKTKNALKKAINELI